jgi:FKBP-type peptidyl-prolyl cis-trans isomerase SlpA
MSRAGPEIVHGSTVCMHFALGPPDGPEMVSNFDETPLTFTTGDGTLSEGLELALYGLRAGSEQSLRIAGDLAFGPRDEANVHDLPLERFPPDIDPRPDLIVAFTGPDGQELAGTVIERGADTARVDFNPPLAGREVLFRVHILSVEPPTDAGEP